MSSDTTDPVAIDLDTFIASHQKKLSKTAQLVRHLDEIARLEARVSNSGR